jgi:FeS assembly SUF system protein
MDHSGSENAAQQHQAQAGASSDPEAIGDAIIESLRSVFDPEIPVNIYELGLIYGVDVDDDGHACIRMTLTSPMCPAAELLPPEVEARARGVPGVTSVELELVWDPPWSPERMSEAARLDLGML